MAGFIAVDDTNKVIVLAFRSADISNWIANLGLILVAIAVYPDCKLVFTGRSLGVALAALSATALRNETYTLELEGVNTLTDVYTQLAMNSLV
ncbi:triacylglycerol lipase B [Penicillium taxi]|uniref:triacylglycerol lipase B n=1 Tax=Penicillium taxi TaxID=168475 RepID=UPI002545BD46|nr:triacylglycerol lipase B [Penicillium taxi]KAJ5908681.1 triacylglycerol lipase B [Penicillium taxi]